MHRRDWVVRLRILSIAICILSISCGGGDGTSGGSDTAPTDAIGSDATGDAGSLDLQDPDTFQWELPSDGMSPDVINPPPDDHCEAIECLECIYWVRTTGSDQADGTSPGAAFATIQPALDAAAAEASYCCHCEVRVGAGAYHVFSTGPDDTIALRERVSLLGGYPAEFDGERDPTAHKTILVGQGQVYHVVTGADDATLDGFTVTGGFAIAEEAPMADTPHYGGGMLNIDVSPTVRDCVFSENQARYGGGVYNAGGAPVFIGCRFEGNDANTQGGGMYCLNSSPILEDPIFVVNSAGGAGGGLAITGMSDAIVAGTTEGSCLLDANVGWNNAGGILLDHSALEIMGCDFTSNKGATMGGAILSLEATLDVSGCDFLENYTYVECDSVHCGKRGGAVACEGGTASVAVSSFTGNLGWSCIEVAGSHQECSGLGGAIGAFAEAEVTITSSTFEGNLGGSGGAIGVQNASLVAESLFLSGNEAPHPTSEESGARGGAIHLDDAVAVIDGMTCAGNIANNGGCLYSWNSELTVNRALIEDHDAANYGGAAYVYNHTDNEAPVVFDGCLFRGNSAWSGGAIYIYLGATPASFNGCTFYGNGSQLEHGRALQIGGAQEGKKIPISNTIFWGHEGPIVAWDGDEPVFDDFKVNTQSVNDSPGTQWDDPLFVNPPDDLRLSEDSPCVDEGANMFVIQETDLDGNPRVVNETVDIGAYERQEVQR